MKKYKTKSGDTFDKIAYRELGSSEYLPQLLNANLDYADVFEFRAGVEIKLPEVSQTKVYKKPPWKD